MPRIVVLGGGVSGLSAAYLLARRLTKRSFRHKIILIDKENLGGWVQTKKTDNGIFELGPRSIRSNGFVGSHTLKLVHDLKLSDDVVPVKRTDPAAKNRMIYKNGELHLLWTNLTDTFRTISPFSKPLAPAFLKSFFRYTSPGIETMYDVCKFKIGEEFTNLLIDPFVRGVFAADIKKLSLKAAFPDVWNRLKSRKDSSPRKPVLNILKHRMEFSGATVLETAMREQWSQWTFEGGLSQLIDGLEEGCKEYGVEIIKNSKVTKMSLQENDKFLIETDDKESNLELFDYVISTIPANELSKILSNEKHSNEENEKSSILNMIGSMLQDIKSVDVAVVNVEFEGYPEQLLPQIGFGHLVPSSEKTKNLGIVYDSCAFPSHDREDEWPSTRLTCMMGGSWFHDLFGDPEHVKAHDLEQAALESISQQLKINEDPKMMLTTVCKQCIPSYGVGHTELVEKMEDLIFKNQIPLSLGGASYWGVSINDCILNSQYITEMYEMRWVMDIEG